MSSTAEKEALERELEHVKGEMAAVRQESGVLRSQVDLPFPGIHPAHNHLAPVAPPPSPNPSVEVGHAPLSVFTLMFMLTLLADDTNERECD